MHFTGLEYPIAAESKRRSVLQWHDTLDLLAPSRRARLVSALVITAFPMNVAILVSTPKIRTSSSVVSACKPPSSSIAICRMQNTFFEARAFNQPLEAWNVSRVTILIVRAASHPLHPPL